MALLVGRQQELTILDQFLDSIPAGPIALIFEGEAGIGKTTVWQAGLSRARSRSYRVLLAASAEPESRLAFAALGDVFADVPRNLWSQLAAPQHHALEVALLRAEADTVVDPRAIALAALNLLRALAATGPLVIALDDVHWIDAPSARALAFAIRRLQADPIGIVVSARTDAPDLLALQKLLPESRVIRTRLSPLSLAEIDQLLSTRLAAAFSRPTVAHVARLSGGNPLFALELGRLVLAGDWLPGRGSAPPISRDLQELVRSRLGRLPSATRAVLLPIAALSQPTEGVVRAALSAEPSLELALQRAIDAEVVVRNGRQLRFSHPLLGSVLYAEADPEERRRLHRRLAEIVDDVEGHAWHLALGSQPPDSGVAATVEAAAGVANQRGAPEAAAALAEQALSFTEPDRSDDTVRRTLLAADFHIAAGDLGRVSPLLDELLTRLHSGPNRAAALQRLAKVRFAAESFGPAVDLLEEALTQSGPDLELRAAIERDLVVMLMQAGALHAADRYAPALLAFAEELADPGLLANALILKGMVDCLLGRGYERAAMDRAVLLATRARQAGADHPALIDPLFHWGAMLKWADEFDEARRVLNDVIDRASERHEESALAPALFQLGELEYWAGNIELAEMMAQRCYTASLHSGQLALRAIPIAFCALLEAHQGRIEAAVNGAEQALSLAQRTGDPRFVMRALRVRGSLDLYRGDLAGARNRFRAIRELFEASGFGEPGLIRYEADAVEVFIELGDLGEAERLTTWLADRGKSLDRPWALMAAARSHGLLCAAKGDLQGALRSLDEALVRNERLFQPFELGRTLLVAGTVARRAKQKLSARQALGRAVELFEQVRAPFWAQRARAELARISGRVAGPAELTPTERRVAELVANGRSNSEVAAHLFLTVKTVEASLTRIYQKLGVRSRTELAIHFAGRWNTPVEKDETVKV